MDYAKRELSQRIASIAEWRRERGAQDSWSLGSEVLARHTRSAEGLDELARFVDQLPDDDPRLAQLVTRSFRGEYFDPGAVLLTELGRFRFHDPDVTVDAFLTEMTEFAQQDQAEAESLGGLQVPGDNPWRADVEIRVSIDDDEDDDDAWFARKRESEL